MTEPVDVDKPIIYGRPRYLAPLLTMAVVGAVAGAIIAYFTYGRVDTASQTDVLGNRAVTQKLTELVRQYESENHAHRERNEEAHACLIWLDVRILHELGDRSIDVRLADDEPCDKYTLPGQVPPLTTTTTQRRTATTRRPTSSTQRTTTTRHATTAPTTTTTTRACPNPTVPGAGACPTTP